MNNNKYSPVENPLNWHPLLTEEQIMHIIGEKGIEVPTDRYGDPELDQEYCQALREYGIEPGKRKNISPTPPYPTPINPDNDDNEDDKVSSKELEENKSNELDDNNNKQNAISKLIYKIKERLSNLITPKENITSHTVDKDEDIIKIKEDNSKEQIIDKINEQEQNNVPNINIPSIDEIVKATSNELENDTKDEVVKITKKYKSFAKGLIAAAMLAMLMSGGRIKDDIKIENTIVENIQDNLAYNINQQISYEDAMKLIFSNLKIGDNMPLEEGMKFNTNSQMLGTSKSLGQEFNLENKLVGDYPITGISIVETKNNEILGSIEDFYEQSSKENLWNFINKTLKEKNVNLEDVEIMLHYGRTTNDEKTRLGWINIEDVLKEEIISNTMNNVSNYKGEIKNFTGDYITINDDDKKVNIPIKDTNGNYITNGSIVIGDNGEEYEITNLDVEEITQLIEESKEVSNGKKITFDIKNINLDAGLPFAIAALVEYKRKKKMNTEAKKNPYYLSLTKEEVKSYIESFQNSNSPKINFYHEANTMDTKKVEKVVREEFEIKTGINIEDTKNFGITIANGGIFVYATKDDKTIFEDLTNEVTNHIVEKNNLIENTYNGYDENAELYFESKSNGRGGR